MLVNHEIELIQNSFDLVKPISSEAAELFYSRLFELNPNVKKLFKSDMKEQGQKLMKSLSVVVSGLDDFPKIVPVVEALAIRHLEYGVKVYHYEDVGEALLWALREGLGTDFSDQHELAWRNAYEALSSMMIAATIEEKHRS